MIKKSQISWYYLYLVLLMCARGLYAKCTRLYKKKKGEGRRRAGKSREEQGGGSESPYPPTPPIFPLKASHQLCVA